jgi:hypothetical protein
MTQTLLVFGASWPAGAELQDTNLAFPFIVGRKMSMDVKNFTLPGSSNDYMVYGFFDFLKNEFKSDGSYVALFCLTPPARHLFWDPVSNKPMHLSNGDPRHKLFFKHFHSATHDIFSMQKNISVLELLCRHHHIKSYFITEMQSDYQCGCPVEINLYPKSLAGILGLDAEDCPKDNPLPDFDSSDGPYPVFSYMVKMYGEKYIYPNIFHPNYEGHELIADKLVNWINCG